MKTAAYWIILIIVLAGIASCRSPLSQEATGNKPPNIIILFADDMGYSDLGCMGSEIRTPTLDRLAREGVLMTHFYTTSRCCPSRASLMTGQYSHRVGIGDMNFDWNLPAYRGFLTNGAVTIPEVLRENGYRTIMTGKWHIGDERPNWPINRGFDRFYGIPAGGGVHFWPPVGLERPVYRNEQRVTPGEDWYSTDAFTTEAISFIQEAQADEKPFFLYTAYIAPHFPLQAWPEDIAKYEGVYEDGYQGIREARFNKQQQLGVLPDATALSEPEHPAWGEVKDPSEEALRMQVYAAMVDRLDQNVKRLMDFLETSGLAENTIVFFLSDNGGCPEVRNNTPEETTGSPKSFVAYGKAWANVSNTPYRKYKAMEEEGGLLTPLIAHWPAVLTQPGLITHEPAHIIDFMATCLDLADVTYPDSLFGQATLSAVGESFLPQLQGESADAGRTLFWEHEGNQAVRHGAWKLVRQHGQDWQLYNLDQDPVELHDLSVEFPDRVEELKERYQAWMAENQVLEWPVAH